MARGNPRAPVSDDGSMSVYVLAVDAGGSNTRALVLDPTGLVLGVGRAASGNPTSGGIEAAVTSIAAAAAAALPTVPSGSVEIAGTVVMAGEQTSTFTTQLGERLAGLGVSRVTLSPDLVGIFGSGTWSADGYALIAGTGSVAGRVRDGRLDRVVGGRGWLLGDAGSGFWLGHRAARAVISALDGQGPPTELTELILAAVAIRGDLTTPTGRSTALRQLISALYARRPVSLAEFAPLLFGVPEDPVAAEILLAGARALADLVAAVWVADEPGPLVVGGSVVTRGWLGAPPAVRERLGLAVGDAPVVPVVDGVIGAAVAGLRQSGVEVDEARFRRLQAAVTEATI